MEVPAWVYFVKGKKHKNKNIYIIYLKFLRLAPQVSYSALIVTDCLWEETFPSTLLVIHSLKLIVFVH